MKVRQIYLAVVSIIVICLQAYAGIPVSGVVNGTWTQGDTMDVVGDLYIVVGDTLTIEPGVVVKFMDYYRFYVYGLLLANGTASDSIKFTCDLIQNPNKWGGIRFTNADSLSSMSYCIIENGLALPPENLGGGVYCSNCSPTFLHCSFINNSADNDGGGVNLSGSSPTFSYCDFIYNHSDDNGGGIAIYNNSSPDIENCTFSNNTTENQGGGIKIEASSPKLINCTISDNEANGNSSSSGGGLMVNLSSISEIVNCQFINNYASANGGAISSYGCTLTFNSCDILTNHVSGGYSNNGAGIYVNNTDLTLNDCNIYNNYNANYGGAIFTYQSANSIINCSISNNSASNCGGGVYLSYPNLTNSYWTDCEFSYNTSVKGGGMYIDHNWTNLNNCTFLSNNTISGTGDNNGGGIFIDGGAGIYVSDCLFENNTADAGGGIFGSWWSSNSIIANCDFINNSANPYGGGAIYNYQADVTISECLFKDNQCLTNGGGFRNHDASPIISKCLFTRNIAVVSGGAIYNNQGGSPNIVRCTLYGNSANTGGGITCIGSTPTINSTIVDSSDGFGIYFATGSSNTIVKYSDFNNNFPINFGGSDVPAGLGTISTTNNNGDPCDAFSNIFLDPLFVDAVNDSFQLQSGSPCIDAGDPSILPDADGTIADIGAFYFDQPNDIGEQPDLNLPLSFKLNQNYPNPFNLVTNIRFGLPKASLVKIDVYNMLGQRVTELLNEHKKAGYHTVEFDGNNFSSGVYYYKITTENFVDIKKAILLK